MLGIFSGINFKKSVKKDSKCVNLRIMTCAFLHVVLKAWGIYCRG